MTQQRKQRRRHASLIACVSRRVLGAPTIFLSVEVCNPTGTGGGYPYLPIAGLEILASVIFRICRTNRMHYCALDVLHGGNPAFAQRVAFITRRTRLLPTSAVLGTPVCTPGSLSTPAVCQPNWMKGCLWHHGLQSLVAAPLLQNLGARWRALLAVAQTPHTRLLANERSPIGLLLLSFLD